MSRAAPSTRGPPAAGRSQSSHGHEAGRACGRPRSAIGLGSGLQGRKRMRMMATASVGLVLGLAASGPALADGEGCTKVTTQSLAIPGLVIEGSKMQEAG